ncbi:MAG: class I SAM-dependent methyltransferase [Candidatus Krumholzibacteria bacterium]|nr:class I SAM-dependent methyltransferase [Candidatus Krumholzibacteria bacterium]
MSTNAFHESDPRRRFTGRVSHYVRYRPGYPEALFDCLVREAGLDASCAVADVGSGSGIFTRALLPRVGRVYAVEPNAEMRAAAERELGTMAGFISVEGTAEATRLPDLSVRLVVAAQAFHWFDPEAARREFQRILEPGGRVALVWNSRVVDATPFMRAYESLLRAESLDYERVDHRRATRRLDGFFAERWHWTFDHERDLDWEASLGYMLSASYVPPSGHPSHARIVEGLKRIFHAHARGGRVAWVYRAELFLGIV